MVVGCDYDIDKYIIGVMFFCWELLFFFVWDVIIGMKRIGLYSKIF